MYSKQRVRIYSLIILLLTIIPLQMLLQTYLVFPSRLLIFKGEEYTYDIATPFSLDAKVDKSGILSINGNVVEDNYKLDSNNPLVIKSDEQGIYNIDFKIFGIVPFRTVEVNVLPKINVVPCGNTIGVKLKTNGVLVVGKSYIENDDGERLEPWKEAGIREGDILLKVNNKKINDTGHLIEILQEISEQAIFIDVKRKDDIYTVKINTVKEKNTDTYKLGLWVRDSTAGIGTLTFYEPFTNYFGALGHGITDVDTGSLLSVGEGNILKSNIISIKKGKRGDPGELKGVFLHGDDMIGDILSNSDYGIFGEIKSEVADVGNESIPVAFRTEVEEGSAYILSNIEGNKIEKFDIEIQKIMRQNERSTKGMIIEITDKDLLEKTGGIVQGMSGSPIIQNDKIVGAITHVFINDPKRGYGIFIDWMVETILEISAKNIK